MKKLPSILFFVAVVILIIPLLLEFRVIQHEIRPLVGAFPKHAPIEMTYENVKSKEWQESIEKSIKSNLIIKPTTVRIQHQLDYWLFNEVHMADLLEGKNHYYFSNGWANARCCKNNLNSDSLNLFVSQLKELQTLMQLKGKFLKIIIPPSKEEIFHTQLPDLLAHENPENDYHLYTDALKRHGVEFDDLLPFYQNLIKTEELPVYSKTSVHWTTYGAHFTLLKILQEMNNYFGENMVTLNRTNLHLRNFKQGDSDGDQEQTLNLIYPIDNQKFAYPQYNLDSSSTNPFKPKVLTIGDSYYWAIKGSWMLHHIYHPDSRYLYYYSTAYSVGSKPELKVRDMDIVSEFETADAIILINSSHNLDGFPFGLQKDIGKIINRLKELP